MTVIPRFVINYRKEDSIKFTGNSILFGLQFWQARDYTGIPMNRPNGRDLTAAQLSDNRDFIS